MKTHDVHATLPLCTYTSNVHRNYDLNQYHNNYFFYDYYQHLSSFAKTYNPGIRLSYVMLLMKIDMINQSFILPALPKYIDIRL